MNQWQNSSRWSMRYPCSAAFGTRPRELLILNILRGVLRRDHRGKFGMGRDRRVGAPHEVNPEGCGASQHQADETEHEKDGGVDGRARLAVLIAHAHGAGGGGGGQVCKET